MKFKIQIGNLFVMASIAFLGPFVFAGTDQIKKNLSTLKRGVRGEKF